MRHDRPSVILNDKNRNKLARECGMSRREFDKAVTELRLRGCITHPEGSSIAEHYELNLPVEYADGSTKSWKGKKVA
jgi:hypothetical protein